jgi:uncharacterized membrane protein YdjX (TVP38/TMEM64 family)
MAEGRKKAVALSLVPALLLGLGLVLLFVFDTGLRSEFAIAWNLLTKGDPEPLLEWLRGYGMWAPVVSGLLQLVTSIFPPGPSFLLGIVNAMLYGVILGGLLTFGTALFAAATCFGIARVIGRPGVERLVSEESLERVDGFMRRRGVLTVFLARLIPFINPDLVSYAAGVTGIRFAAFLLAVGAGAIPSTIFYSILGATAAEASGWVALAVVVSSVVPLILLVMYRQRIRAWAARSPD